MKVLIAEDSRLSRRMIERSVREIGHDVEAVGDGQAAWARLEQGGVDVVVSAWVLPGMDGLELCRQLRSGGLDSYTYFILLTAKSQREERFEALAAGIDDFLTKPLDSGDLKARLDVAARILAWERQLQAVNDALLASTRRLMEQAAEIDRMREEAEYLASHDSLTGLMTRRAWFTELRREGYAAIAIFDVDHFKRVNDTWGHPAGDAVLTEVARRLYGAFPDGTTLARVGGEEFAVAFPDTVDPVAACERALEWIRGEDIDVGPELIRVTASAGLAYATGSEEADYGAADASLYRAKNGGRDRLVVGDAEAAAA